MSYSADWKDAKKKFETATGKKKPSEKVMGAFRKSSGLEKACAGLDSALKKPAIDVCLKAEEVFITAQQQFMDLVQKAEQSDKDVDYKRELGALGNALNKILEEYTTAKQIALQNAPQRLADILGPYFKDLTSLALLGLASVKAFGTSKAVGLSGKDNTPLKDALDCQNAFKAAIHGYQAAVNAALKEAKTEYTLAQGAQRGVALCDAIAEFVAPIEDRSAFMQIGYWIEAQKQDFTKKGAPQEHGNFIKQGAVSGILTQLRTDLDNDYFRLSTLSNKIGKLGH